MQITIIGFTGKKGHGKTTASSHATQVLEQKGYKVIHLRFKDAIIETMWNKLNGTLTQFGVHYGMSIEELFDKKPPMMRVLMQEVGTEIYRAINPDYWVLEWYKKLHVVTQEVKEEESLVVLTDDVRFVNEFQLLKAKGGKLLRINRTGYDDGIGNNHATETEMDTFSPDYVLEATTKEELEKAVEEFINNHF